MTEYISREDLLHMMQVTLERLPQGVFNPNKIGFIAAMEGIKNFPAADVVPMDFHERCLQIEIQKRMALEKADVREVKRGKWERRAPGDHYDFLCICSNCRQYWIDADEKYDFNYCPNCGADMRPEPPKEET